LFESFLIFVEVEEEFDEKNVCERKRLTVCFEKSNWKRTRKLWNLIIL
jgi:hypothetical protein